eukprot:1156619-Pelagomonas_calceolata.AAC.15
MGAAVAHAMRYEQAACKERQITNLEILSKKKDLGEQHTLHVIWPSRYHMHIERDPAIAKVSPKPGATMLCYCLM